MLINLGLQINFLVLHLLRCLTLVILVVVGCLAMIEDVDELLHPGIDSDIRARDGNGTVLLLWSRSGLLNVCHLIIFYQIQRCGGLNRRLA